MGSVLLHGVHGSRRRSTGDGAGRAEFLYTLPFFSHPLLPGGRYDNRRHGGGEQKLLSGRGSTCRVKLDGGRDVTIEASRAQARWSRTRPAR